MGKEFEVYDALISKDEKISLEEYEKYFVELETTRHGYALKMLERDAADMQRTLDMKNDGNVSLEEFVEVRAKVVYANWNEIESSLNTGEFVSAGSLKGKKGNEASPAEGDKPDADGEGGNEGASNEEAGKDDEAQEADKPVDDA